MACLIVCVGIRKKQTPVGTKTATLEPASKEAERRLCVRVNLLCSGWPCSSVSLVLAQFLCSTAPNPLHTTVFLQVAYYPVPTGPLSQVCWLSLYTEAVEMFGAGHLELAWITSHVVLLP